MLDDQKIISFCFFTEQSFEKHTFTKEPKEGRRGPLSAGIIHHQFIQGLKREGTNDENILLL